MSAVLSPTTIQQARKDGAVEGTMLSAPLAPAVGPITVGVTAPTTAKGDVLAREPLVVVVAVKFWKSETIIWLRRLVIGAFGLAGAIVLKPYTLGTKPWAEFTFASAWLVFSHAFVVALCSAIFAYLKTRFNNPIAGGSK